VKRLENIEEDFVGNARDARHGELSVRDQETRTWDIVGSEAVRLYQVDVEGGRLRETPLADGNC
jgi:hypothetical protein